MQASMYNNLLLFTDVICRLAVEEEQKNKDLADEMARSAPLQESVSPVSWLLVTLLSSPYSCHR